MGPLGTTLPVVATARGNATSHSRRMRFTAAPCFLGHAVKEDGTPDRTGSEVPWYG